MSYLIKPLTAALLVFAANAVTAQVNVTGRVTADNFFVVNLTYGQGTGVTIPAITNTGTSTNNQWSAPSDYSFTIDETNLAYCNIQIVAWNEGGPAGVSASFQGNVGTAATGGGDFRVFDTLVPSATFGGTPPYADHG